MIQHDDAAGEDVRQGILGRQGNGQATDGQPGDQAADVDAPETQDGSGGEDDDEEAEQDRNEVADGGVKFPFAFFRQQPEDIVRGIEEIIENPVEGDDDQGLEEDDGHIFPESQGYGSGLQETGKAAGDDGHASGMIEGGGDIEVRVIGQLVQDEVDDAHRDDPEKDIYDDRTGKDRQGGQPVIESMGSKHGISFTGAGNRQGAAGSSPPAVPVRQIVAWCPGPCKEKPRSRMCQQVLGQDLFIE